MNCLNAFVAANGRHHHHHTSSSNEKTNPEPSAPPLEGNESPTHINAKEETQPQEIKEPTTSMYPILAVAYTTVATKIFSKRQLLVNIAALIQE